MKLVTLTLVVNDFRDMDTSDDSIDALLDDARDAIHAAVGAVANKTVSFGAKVTSPLWVQEATIIDPAKLTPSRSYIFFV